MSRSLNRVTLIGNLGNDPDVRATPTGGRVAQFSLATTRVWSDAAGQRQEKTDWHRCVAWNNGKGGGQLADLLERYVRKGDKLYVEGRLETRQWQDKEGQTRYMTEVIVREIILLSSKREGEDGAPAYAPPARSTAKAGAATGNGKGGDFTDFPGALETHDDDDLPF